MQNKIGLCIISALAATVMSGCAAVNGIIDLTQKLYPANSETAEIIDAMQSMYITEEFASEAIEHLDEIQQVVGEAGEAMENAGLIPEGALAETNAKLQEAIQALRDMEAAGMLEPGTVDNMMQDSESPTAVAGQEFRIHAYNVEVE